MSSFKLEVHYNGVCIFHRTVDKLDNLQLTLKPYTVVAHDHNRYFTKCKQITPFWLFVKIIEEKFNVTTSESQRISDEIWPQCAEKISFQNIVRHIKSTIRDQGFCSRDEGNIIVLSAETMNAIRALTSK